MSFVKVHTFKIIKDGMKKAYTLNTSIGVKYIINWFAVCLDVDICELRVWGSAGPEFLVLLWILQVDFYSAVEQMNVKQVNEYNWAGYFKKKNPPPPLDTVIMSFFSLGVHQMFTITCLVNWFSYILHGSGIKTLCYL